VSAFGLTRGDRRGPEEKVNQGGGRKEWDKNASKSEFFTPAESERLRWFCRKREGEKKGLRRGGKILGFLHRGKQGASGRAYGSLDVVGIKRGTKKFGGGGRKGANLFT